MQPLISKKLRLFVAENTARYKSRTSVGGNLHEALGWGERPRIINRYKLLVDRLELRGKRVLDVGAGIGSQLSIFDGLRIGSLDLVENNSEFLKELTSRCSLAPLEFPVKIHATDLLDFEASCFYDIILMSGLFNSGGSASALEFLEVVLKKYWSICNDVLSFNVLSSDADRKRDELFYASLGQIQAIVSHLSLRYEISKTVFPYEYTVRVFRDSGDRTAEGLFS